jgi:chromosomal replication initiator protein
MSRRGDLLDLMERRVRRLERALQPPPVPPGSIRRVLAAVAAAYGVSEADIVSDRRTRPIIEPRQVAMALARRCTRHSLPTIGHALGRRDHTTVLHGVRRIEARAAEDPEFAARLAALASLITTTTQTPRRAA